MIRAWQYRTNLPACRGKRVIRGGSLGPSASWAGAGPSESGHLADIMEQEQIMNWQEIIVFVLAAAAVVLFILTRKSGGG